LWFNYPLVFDAFRCKTCEKLSGPRGLSAEELEQLNRLAVKYVKQNEFNAAEFCFRRAANSWPHFITSRANLGNFFCDLLVREQRHQNRKEIVERCVEYMKSSYLTALSLSMNSPEKNPQSHSISRSSSLDDRRMPAFVLRHLGMLYREFEHDFQKSTSFLQQYVERIDVSDKEKQQIQLYIDENKAHISIDKAMSVLLPYVELGHNRLESEQQSSSSSEEKEKKEQSKQGENDCSDVLLELDAEQNRMILEAIQNIEEGLKVCPFHSKARFVLAKMQQLLNEATESYRHFQILYEAQPNDKEIAKEYFASCLRLGDLENALKSSQQILQLDKNDPALQSNYSLVLLLANQVEEAHHWAK